jgi:hypothetical protein
MRGVAPPMAGHYVRDPAEGGTGSKAGSSLIIQNIRGVAQLVARYVRDVEAAGSSPVTPTSPAVVRIYRDEGGLFVSAGYVGQGPTITTRGVAPLWRGTTFGT